MQLFSDSLGQSSGYSCRTAVVGSVHLSKSISSCSLVSLIIVTCFKNSVLFIFEVSPIFAYFTLNTDSLCSLCSFDVSYARTIEVKKVTYKLHKMHKWLYIVVFRLAQIIIRDNITHCFTIQCRCRQKQLFPSE